MYASMLCEKSFTRCFRSYIFELKQRDARHHKISQNICFSDKSFAKQATNFEKK